MVVLSDFCCINFATNECVCSYGAAFDLTVEPWSSCCPCRNGIIKPRGANNFHSQRAEQPGFGHNAGTCRAPRSDPRNRTRRALAPGRAGTWRPSPSLAESTEGLDLGCHRSQEPTDLDCMLQLSRGAFSPPALAPPSCLRSATETSRGAHEKQLSFLFRYLPRSSAPILEIWVRQGNMFPGRLEKN